MYLVVRREMTSASFAELAAATGQAVVRCARQYTAEPAYAEAFAAWYSTSYRKVALRANERDWAKLLTGYDVALGGPDNGALLGVLPPLRKSARDRFLVGLQAYGPGIDELPDRPSIDPGRPAMGLMLNPAIVMSAGKALAQLGHGALMAADRWRERDPAAEQGWGWGGAPFMLLPATPAHWSALRANPDASLVVDGGLTELAPGAETVLALPLL
jgi:peptidyl-tRNA hydrolase